MALQVLQSFGAQHAPQRKRCAAAGKQGNLKAWLASASAPQPQAAIQQPAAACTVSASAAAKPGGGAGCLTARKDASSSVSVSASASVLGKRPGAKSGSAKQKAAKQKGVAGQSRLKIFMRPHAGLKPEQTTPASSSAVTPQDSVITAKALPQPQELAPEQQMQSQPGSQPVSIEAARAALSETAPGTGVPELVTQDDSQIKQAASLGCMRAACFQDSAGELECESSGRASAGRATSMQSKHSCVSSGVDADELVEAATRWEEVKGESLKHYLLLSQGSASALFEKACQPVVSVTPHDKGLAGHGLGTPAACRDIHNPEGRHMLWPGSKCSPTPSPVA